MKLNELYVFSINGFPEEHESLDKEAFLGLGRAAAWTAKRALPKIKGFFPKIKNMFSSKVAPATGVVGGQTKGSAGVAGSAGKKTKVPKAPADKTTTDAAKIKQDKTPKKEKNFLDDFMKSPRGKEFVYSAAPGAIAGFATADDDASLGSRLGRAAVFGGLSGGAGLGISKALRMYDPKKFSNKKIFGNFQNVW